MDRSEMVKVVEDKLSVLSDRQLVHLIATYFRHNAVMPGEKAVKDRAVIMIGHWQDGETSLGDSAREELIKQFASVCVKEVKLTNAVNRIPLKEFESATKDVYEMTAMVNGIEGRVEVIKGKGPRKVFYYAGYLPKGFVKNHDCLAGYRGVITSVDYSNGRLKNMSCRMIIDLSQAYMDYASQL